MKAELAEAPLRELAAAKWLSAAAEGEPRYALVDPAQLPVWDE